MATPGTPLTFDEWVKAQGYDITTPSFVRSGGTDNYWTEANPAYMSPEQARALYNQYLPTALTTAGITDGQSLYVDPAVAAADPRGAMANLVRAQWADFQNTALPVKDQLVGMTTYNGNRGVVDALKTQGMKQADTSFDNAVGTAQRQTERYGMSMNPAEQTTLDRAANLGRAGAKVDAANTANQFQKDLNQQIVAGSGMSGGRSYSA